MLRSSPPRRPILSEPHDLLAGPDGWEYRWLTFDGARFDQITRDYGLSRAQPAGPCPAASAAGTQR